MMSPQRSAAWQYRSLGATEASALDSWRHASGSVGARRWPSSGAASVSEPSPAAVPSSCGDAYGRSRSAMRSRRRRGGGEGGPASRPGLSFSWKFFRSQKSGKPRSTVKYFVCWTILCFVSVKIGASYLILCVFIFTYLLF